MLGDGSKFLPDLKISRSRQRRFYITIVDGVIDEYKGVNETITIENITIKSLARSEDDKVAYMPNVELILDATEKLISIPFDSNKIITCAVVEQCTCTRQMNFQVRDLAYVQDIEALDNKIIALAEVSHYNDENMASIQETYTTVDEVNEALSNYVLKSDMPPAADLSGYRKKDDLSVNINVNLAIEHKTPPYGVYDFSCETAVVEFHEGALLEGYAIVYDDENDDYVHIDFSITFHTDWVDGDLHLCDTIISTKVEGFCWNERTNVFSASGAVEMAVHLNSAKLYIEDTFALKTENEELKTKISALEARISALENA